MASRPDRGGTPRRTCVGCRQVRDVPELIRIVRRDDGNLQVGRTLPGRGAWLCQASPDCLERAARTGGFARAFRAPVPPDRLEALRLELGGGTPRSGIDFVPGTQPARD